MFDKYRWLHSSVLLSVTIVLLLFANGRNNIPIASWLAPLFLMRFVRTHRGYIGLPVAWLALFLTWTFQFRGMVPLPAILFYITGASFGVIFIIPYIVDRFLKQKSHGFIFTLIFPSVWIICEFIVFEFSPSGSWSSVAYTQYENLVLLQILSVTGLLGISFLIAWFAAVGNWLWVNNFNPQLVCRGSLIFLTVIVAVLGFGGIRLNFFPPDAPTVQIASLSDLDIGACPGLDTLNRIYSNQLSPEEEKKVRSQADIINTDLLERSLKEAEAGARIIFWGEGNACCFKDDEPDIIKKAADLAHSQQIYMGVAVLTLNTSLPKPTENKIILIDPKGEKVWEYWKSIPVPGLEKELMALSDGRIKSSDTPYGRIGAAICYDMDFPWHLRQAGEQQIDILLSPSNDWKEIDPFHSHMARFRAIEQGFNMVRHVSHGLSIATDYQGRILASMDHYATQGRNLIAHVPTRGVRTIYSLAGDWIVWSSLIGFIFILFVSRKR